MAFAILNEPNSKGQRAVTMKRDIALRFIGYMNDPSTIPDDFWREKTNKIKTIYLGKAPRYQRDSKGNFPKTAVDVEPPVQADSQQQLTNPGVLQGMSEIIPRGDR